MSFLNNILAVLAILICMYLLFFLWKGHFAIKPGKKDILWLRKINLVRLAKDQSGPLIKFSPSIPKGDWTTRGRAVIYFFVGEPSDYIRTVQNIEGAEKKYVIPFSHLNEDSVLIRKSDKVVAYLTDYENKPLSISDLNYSEVSGLRKKIYNTWFFGKIIFLSILLVTGIISIIFLLIFNLFSITTLTLSCLLAVILVVPVPYILPFLYSR